MNWFIKCLRHYADFSGRACRLEYWYFMLYYFLFAIAGALLGGFVLDSEYGGLVYCAVLLPPLLSATVRRLHDTGRSGKWLLALIGFYLVYVALLLGFVLLWVHFGDMAMTPGWLAGFAVLLLGCLLFEAGYLVLFVWLCLPGTDGANKYGPAPRREVPPRSSQGAS